MGLSIAISGGIILSVMLLVFMTVPGLMEKFVSIGETSTDSMVLATTIFQTDIDLDSLLAAAGSPFVNFTLNNDEQEKLWQFEKFDVIVEYEGVTSGGLIEELSYSGDCLGGVPAVGNWCIELISGIMDPGILNGGEAAIIITQVGENLANGNAIVSLNTDNGVIATLPSFKPTSIDISSNPPVPCQIGFYGRTFHDTDTGVSYICDSSRDKWLSLEMMVLFGEESSDCLSGRNPNTEKNCAVEWGNGVGTDSDTPQMGLYIPYNATLVGYGVSIDNNDCGGGTYDFELWGTSSNTVDEPYALQAEVTGLSGEANNANNLNLDIGVNQYIMWGLENNCGSTINDFNAIIYLKWKHDNP